MHFVSVKAEAVVQALHLSCVAKARLLHAGQEKNQVNSSFTPNIWVTGAEQEDFW